MCYFYNLGLVGFQKMRWNSWGIVLYMPFKYFIMEINRLVFDILVLITQWLGHLWDIGEQLLRVIFYFLRLIQQDLLVFYVSPKAKRLMWLLWQVIRPHILFRLLIWLGWQPSYHLFVGRQQTMLLHWGRKNRGHCMIIYQQLWRCVYLVRRRCIVADTMRNWLRFGLLKE